MQTFSITKIKKTYSLPGIKAVSDSQITLPTVPVMTSLAGNAALLLKQQARQLIGNMFTSRLAHEGLTQAQINSLINARETWEDVLETKSQLLIGLQNNLTNMTFVSPSGPAVPTPIPPLETIP